MWIETEGEGPPLVLLHGWAMHGGIFRPLSDRLREHFTLYRVDLPGHGHSPVRDGALDATSTLEHLFASLPAAPWLGWSLGGLLAMHAAARRPDRVTHLIALCASPRFVRAADWPHAVDAEIFRSFGRDLGRDYRGTIDRFLALEAHGSDHMRDELRALRPQPLLLDGRSDAEYWGESARAMRTGHLPGAVSLPALQLRAALGAEAKRPVLPEGPAVAYAHDAFEGLAYLTLLIAGHGVPARLYAEGWAEWAADGNLPADAVGYPDREQTVSAQSQPPQDGAISPGTILAAALAFALAAFGFGWWSSRRRLA